MRVRPLEIADVLLIEPQVFRDERGFFLETYHAERYAEAGIRCPFGERA
jgi:dTDP-4-dehydrorhamnose 3,5-epimerase